MKIPKKLYSELSDEGKAYLKKVNASRRRKASKLKGLKIVGLVIGKSISKGMRTSRRRVKRYKRRY